MLSLKVRLDSLDFSRQLLEVKNLVDTAEVKTTFWGSRVVEIKGFTESVYLEELAEKIVSAGRKRSDDDDLLLAERIHGIEIVAKIKDFYLVTDEKIRNSNFLTRLLNWLREFSFMPHNTTRYHIENTAEQSFCAFSPSKYEETFDEPVSHLDSGDGALACQVRIIASEAKIRSLLQKI